MGGGAKGKRFPRDIRRREIYHMSTRGEQAYRGWESSRKKMASDPTLLNDIKDVIPARTQQPSSASTLPRYPKYEVINPYIPHKPRGLDFPNCAQEVGKLADILNPDDYRLCGKLGVVGGSYRVVWRCFSPHL